MDSKPASLSNRPSGRVLSRLARKDQRRLSARLAEMSAPAIAEAVQELTPVLRNQVLELVECVDEVVPLLPETELASTIVATGVADAGWLVEFATARQRAACVDLDCWRGTHFSPSKLMEWVDALIEVGDEALAEALDDLDLELWVLALQHMADFKIVVSPLIPDWETRDGVVHFKVFHNRDEERVRAILDAAAAHRSDFFWQLVHGTVGSGRVEFEEDVAHAQASRMRDLGFPSRERAMQVYKPLAADASPTVDIDDRERDTGPPMGSHLPFRLSGTGVGGALAELPVNRATELMGQVLAVANALAVADELPLADPESTRTSLEKAVHGIDVALSELARRRGRPESQILDAVPPLDLFRIGATLSPDLRPLKTRARLDNTEARTFGTSEADDPHGARLDRDWNVELEEISETDAAVGPDGRPR